MLNAPPAAPLYRASGFVHWRKADIGHNADVRKVPATDIPRARPTVARCFLRGTKPGWNEDAGLCYHLAIVDLVRSQGERRGPME